jgi:microcystin-dependent protein
MAAQTPFVAEICMFPFNFAPTGFAFCNGQLMPISQNTALFSLLGTFYGGDGKSTFGLPDLQGMVPIHQGQGSGLSERFLGEMSGTSNVTLLISEFPNHSHSAEITIPVGGVADTDSPKDAYPATFGIDDQVNGNPAFFYSSVVSGAMGTVNSEISTLEAGAGFPHNNMQPTLFINYCIALQGVFPPRS